MKQFEITYHTVNTEAEVGQTGINSFGGNKLTIEASSEEEARTKFNNEHGQPTPAETNYIDIIKEIK